MGAKSESRSAARVDTRPSAASRFKLAAGGGLVAVLAAVAFLLFGAAGPGFDPIAQAAALSARAPGYKMRMTLALSSPLFDMTGEAHGVVDLRDRAASMSMVMNLPNLPQITQVLGGTTLTMNMVMERTEVYVRFPPALAAKLPYDKPWLKFDLGRLLDSEGLSSVTSMMNNPISSDATSQLSYLRATSGDVANLGPEDVDGIVATHYRADVDFNQVANAVPPAKRAEMAAAVSKIEALLHSDHAPVDVWIDAHHLVRRMRMTFNFAPTGQPAFQESITEHMTDYGPQPRPAAPPADQVQDVTETGGLGGL
jgi:hypothetical protein